VLEQSGIGANFQLCIDLSNASSGTIAIVASPSAGFTGGTTLNRPTATDEFTVTSDGSWYYNTTNATSVISMSGSTDGAVTRVMVFQANFCVAYWSFELSQNPITGWTPAFAGWVKGSGSGADIPTYTNMVSTANGRGRVGANNMSLFMTTEGYNSQTVGQKQTVPDDNTGEWPMTGIGMSSESASVRGRKGNLFDKWFTSTTLATGDTAPNDTSRQFLVVGDLFVPWDGSVPVIA
jgi:hypothetical protein